MNVAFGPLNLGLPPDEVDERVRRALAATGCEDLAKRPPYHLSGGEKRAVAISAVLAMSPDILVLDEPASNLDPWGRRQLINLLRGFEHTKIIASHDLDMVLGPVPADHCPAPGRGAGRRAHPGDLLRRRAAGGPAAWSGPLSMQARASAGV